MISVDKNREVLTQRIGNPQATAKVTEEMKLPSFQSLHKIKSIRDSISYAIGIPTSSASSSRESTSKQVHKNYDDSKISYSNVRNGDEKNEIFISENSFQSPKKNKWNTQRDNVTDNNVTAQKNELTIHADLNSKSWSSENKMKFLKSIFLECFWMTKRMKRNIQMQRQANNEDNISAKRLLLHLQDQNDEVSLQN